MSPILQTKPTKNDKNKRIKENILAYLDFYLGARFPNGTTGYVADPAALARGRRQYLLQKTDSIASVSLYWKTLEGYQVQARNDTETKDWLLDSDHICAFGPGRGFEEEGGYKILVEKIRIDATNDTILHHTSNTATPVAQRSQPVRVLCAIYTYPRMRDLLRTQALSWGYQCDGFLAFSTETIAELGLVDLVHEGPESYMNMWQKVRSLWIYLYHNYGNDYDFFHLGGDDLYVVVENLRKFLQQVQDSTAETIPIFLGQWIPKGSPKGPNQDQYYVAGAPGYTLNQRALKLLVEQAIPNCHVHVKASYEDRLISKCLRDLGILGQDTREKETGEQQYHDCSPNHLFTAVSNNGGRGSFHSKLMSYWEVLPHPMYPNTTTGPKHGLESAAVFTVNFHNLYHPVYVARIHALLYKQTCPADSPLGRGLKTHLYVR
jgi:glycoprotein-N-acetylgalactosamine 3-beta-galactosyltransferase